MEWFIGKWRRNFFNYISKITLINIVYCLFREGTIQIGDEIVNVSGRSVRGMSMIQVRELLESAYNSTEQSDIDLVICRYVTKHTHKSLRKKSIDSYLTEIDDTPRNQPEFNEFASTALK